MNQLDKLEQYIKREVDSIPYEEEDLMWEKFKQIERPSSDKFNLWKNIFKNGLPILILLSVGFFLTTQNNVSIEKAGLVSSKERTTPLLESKSSKDKLITISNNSINTKESNPNNKTVFTTNNTVSNSISDNSIPLSKSKIASIKTIKKKIASSNKTNKNPKLQTLNENKFGNSKQQLNNQSLENNQYFSPVDSEKETNKNNLSSKNIEEVITSVPRYSSELSILENEFSLIPQNFKTDSLINPIDFKGPKPRPNLYSRSTFLVSPNGIYNAKFDIGHLRKNRNNTAFRYGIGLSFEDGYSVSQDSIIILNGIIIEEITKDTDLSYLINAGINLEYIFKIKQFYYTLGSNIEYGIYNYFNNIEIIKNRSTPFITSTQRNSTFINNWTGIQRLGFSLNAGLSYKWNRFEIGATVSKRLNPIIKSDKAKSNKSNTPFQFGLSITNYY